MELDVPFNIRPTVYSLRTLTIQAGIYWLESEPSNGQCRRTLP